MPPNKGPNTYYQDIWKPRIRLGVLLEVIVTTHDQFTKYQQDIPVG